MEIIEHDKLKETFFPVEKRRLLWENKPFFSHEDIYIPCEKFVIDKPTLLI